MSDKIDWQKFHDLTDLMENIEKNKIPDGFTAEVMSALPEKNNISLAGRLFSTSLHFGFRNSVTKTECSFYFFLTGFFYLVLGAIMMMGFPFSAIIRHNGWLSMQPFFGILVAFDLMILGIVLYKKGSAAVGFVRGGTVFFTVLILINACLGAVSVHPATASFLIVCFSITGMVLAILLGIALDHYHPENIFSEVNG